jgi:glutamate carboxypeptidase
VPAAFATADKVDMALEGIGLMGSGGHTVNEVGDLATRNAMSHPAAVTLYRSSQPEI